jgi:ATP adenylyltransferase
VEQGGVRFIVRRLRNRARKEAAEHRQRAAQRQDGPAPNPFLPYDKALFVADISDTHVALLNKYNVVDHHLLIVTRAFEEQRTLLTQADFEALAVCLEQIDGLAFYNAGTVAGASQRHKHLQLVPLPLTTPGPRVPIETLLSQAGPPIGGVDTEAGLPFVHAVTRLGTSEGSSAGPRPTALLAAYHTLLKATGLLGDNQPRDGMITPPYNLLITRLWMLLVPRARESYTSISVNALGFAGSLLVRDAGQLQRIKETGPMTVLTEVAVNKPGQLR